MESDTMTTHILSMTYGPKIEGVRNGTIRQTIRKYNPKRPIVFGDKLLIHGWEGKPYRSPWNWRIEATVINTEIHSANNKWFGLELWVNDCAGVLRQVAARDGIEPPTSLGLKAVLEGFHGSFTDEPVRFQIIRW